MISLMFGGFGESYVLFIRTSFFHFYSGWVTSFRNMQPFRSVKFLLSLSQTGVGNDWSPWHLRITIDFCSSRSIQFAKIKIELWRWYFSRLRSEIFNVEPERWSTILFNFLVNLLSLSSTDQIVSTFVNIFVNHLVFNIFNNLHFMNFYLQSQSGLSIVLFLRSIKKYWWSWYFCKRFWIVII